MEEQSSNKKATSKPVAYWKKSEPKTRNEKSQHVSVDIIEFYPVDKPKPFGIVGSLHIYLNDYDIDVRGFPLVITKTGLLLWMPSQIGKRHDTGEKARYPVFRFANLNKQKAFVAEVKKHLPAFLKEWLKEHPERSDLLKLLEMS